MKPFVTHLVLLLHGTSNFSVAFLDAECLLEVESGAKTRGSSVCLPGREFHGWSQREELTSVVPLVTTKIKRELT
jgi:hypothetical protein